MQILLDENFDLYFMGILKGINIENDHEKDKDVQLIDRIEDAQMDGRLPIVIEEDQEKLVKYKLHVSTQGIKVVQPITGDDGEFNVLFRNPLHHIEQVVYYNDCFNKCNLLIKICSNRTTLNQIQSNIFDCFIFQCLGEDQAVEICKYFKQMFDSFPSSFIA